MAGPVFKSVDAAGEGAENRLGRLLQYEREKRGLSSDEVARELCLSATVIRDLEAGDLEVLPESVYVRGYIRAYCRLLKIDPEPLLEEFVLKPAGQEEDDFLPAMNEHVHHLTRLWGSLAVLSVIILLVSFWWLEQPHGFNRLPQALAPTLAPVPVPVTQPAPVLQAPADERTRGITDGFTEPEAEPPPAAVERAAPAQSDDLAEITFYSSTRSWAHLTDGSDDVILNRMLVPDYQGTVYGTFPLDFKIGDARGVRVWVNGIEYDLTQHLSQLNTAFFRLEKSLQ